MNDLGFRLEQIGGAWVKIRDDGRRGPAVADEAALWRLLVMMEVELSDARTELADAKLERDRLQRLVNDVTAEAKPAKVKR